MADFGKLNFSVSFNPTSAFPIDARYYFSTLAAAQEAAQGAVEVGSADGTYFIGENIVVVEGNSATLYVIQPNKSLKAVGTKPVGDNKSIEVAENGTISLKGLVDAQTGAYPSKKADGSIEWVKPDNTTVEGLQQTITTLEGRVDTAETDILGLKGTVGDGESGLVKEVADIKTDIKTNYATKQEVATAKTEAISEAGTQADAKISTKVGDLGKQETVVAYVGTEIGKVNTEVEKKANKATTLAGYGITDAMTTEATTQAIETAKQGATTDAVSQAKSYTDSKGTELIGKEADLATADTIYGAKKHATEAIATAKGEVEQKISDDITAAKTELIGSGTATSTTIKGAVDEAKDFATEQISAKLGSVYKPAGSVTFANLPTPEKSIEGNVYNVTDKFSADAKFIDGEVGKSYPAGTNVVVIAVSDQYKYDVLTGMVDLSAYSTTEQMNTAISSAVEALDKADVAVEKQFVTAVSEENGVISVTRKALEKTDIPTIDQSQVNGLETELGKKANDADLAAIAKSGSIMDLIQSEGDVLVLNCGNATV